MMRMTACDHLNTAMVETIEALGMFDPQPESRAGFSVSFFLVIRTKFVRQSKPMKQNGHNFGAPQSDVETVHSALEAARPENMEEMRSTPVASLVQALLLQKMHRNSRNIRAPPCGIQHVSLSRINARQSRVSLRH